MSFDKPTRNALAKMVGAVRQILKDDVAKQLQSDFRLQPDGTALSLEGLTEDQRGAAIELRDLLEHYVASEAGAEKTRRAVAFDRLAREIGFTILNRLAALRLCEERGLVIECVRKGMASDGVRMFEMFAHGALGTRYQTYRVFIENLYDELALDLGALFNRHFPPSRVFPSERALEQVLALLNDAALAHLWREDETIGWIYQYYNDESERKQMRDESQAPRNSRELAVRNQFFTPRYVVEFLTGNTLGRIWYEMRGGDTRLADECRYLVHVPVDSQQSTVNSGQPDGRHISQSKIENQKSKIRNKKDPREILMLDPAGGSGHFGLYCFDLFETIYAEAYDDFDLGPKLRADFPDRDEFLRQIPRLILEYNIHIIDIDPRACQIAALALWLRAQRSWQMMNLKPEARPRIRKVNVVCAEPMPGEKDLLEEFVADLEPKELGELVRFVFERMKLAGEAGSLLKIEEDLRDEIDRLRKKAGPMFARGDFWDSAEGRVLDALKAYAEQAENGNTTRRRLFADDAAQGFAFIDLCRKKYDVVLMNPPFGLGPKKNFAWLTQNYPDSYVDLYATFISRATKLSECLFGAITSRSWLMTKKLARLRQKVILPRLITLLDLGTPVMDGAMVQSCAFVLENSAIPISPHFPVFDRTNTGNKDEALHEMLSFKRSNDVYIVKRDEITALPEAKILYVLPSNVIRIIRTASHSSTNLCISRQGMKTFNDFRFLRLREEVNPIDIGVTKEWEPFSKGGPYATFYSELPLLVRWARTGTQVAEENRRANGQTAQARQASAYYRRAGGTYSRRCKNFGVRVLPSGCIIGEKGPAVFPTGNLSIYFVIAFLNSRFINLLVNLQANANQYDSGVIDRLPWIQPSREIIESLESNARAAIDSIRHDSSRNECDALFARFLFGDSLQKIMSQWKVQKAKLQKTVELSRKEISANIDELYNVHSLPLERLTTSSTSDELDDENFAEDENDLENENDHLINIEPHQISSALFSYVVGCAFGRWDIRIALDPTLAPKLQDPFDPLPVCPPGMLVGTDGLPATPGNVVSEEWLRARPNAITLPDTAALQAKNLPLTTSHYPLTIAWDGILVDDPGLDGQAAHPADIVRRVREVLIVLWGDRVQSIEDEACEILGVSDLRDYFRKPTGFFANHLKRYSKSRRQAPIYLPLSTASGRYTVWVYYHRLTQDTHFTIVNQYVNPKIESVDKRVDQLAEKIKQASGKATTDLREQLNDAKELLSELREFRAELLRVAQLPYKLDLNDGIIITVAPLHKLFRLRKWANDTAAVWKKLEAGEYDWSHMAYNIWTSRVKKKCETDRSIAIAHGLEHLCKVNPKKASKGRRKNPEEEDDG